jgi:hypothetical protein
MRPTMGPIDCSCPKLDYPHVGLGVYILKRVYRLDDFTGKAGGIRWLR